MLPDFAIGRWWYGERQVTRRTLVGARSARIAGVVEGEGVKLVGKLAYADEPLQAPFSRRRCAAYWLTVEQQSGGDSESGTRSSRSDAW